MYALGRARKRHQLKIGNPNGITKANVRVIATMWIEDIIIRTYTKSTTEWAMTMSTMAMAMAMATTTTSISTVASDIYIA